MKLIHVQSLELLRRVCKVIEGTSDEMKIKNAGVHSALIDAVMEGNIEFITSIAKANPSLVWNPNASSMLFQVALMERQAKIFSLIYGLRDKLSIVGVCDENRNNMLHRAAQLAPSRQLNHIQGPALQMQRELQWFKVPIYISNTKIMC